MSRLPSTFQNLNSQALADPRVLEQYTQQAFGLSAKQMDIALRLMMSVSQGRMPDPDGMKFALQAGKQKFGWSEQRTRSELKQVLDAGSPQQRIEAYLTANGNSKPNPTEYNIALNLVQNGLRADIESGIQTRLAEGKGNNAPRDTFNGMKPSERVLADSQDKADLRNTLTALSGGGKPATYESKVHAVMKARSQLADRVEVQTAQQAAGHTPSLRESLSNTFDEKTVAAASEDLGMGNPIEEARETVERESSHMSDSYDVTEGLRD